MRNVRNTKGFTLIELMIVVVIIGILAAIAIPKFSPVSKRAKESEAAPILKQLHTLQERYVMKMGQYATDIDELEGGSSNYTGQYYTFQLTSNPSGGTYVACATPTDPAQNLRSFSINQAGTVAEGTC